MLLVHIENGWCAPFVDSEVNEPTPPAGVLHSANKSPSQHTANCYQIFKKNEHRSFPTSQLPNYWPKRDVNHSPENVAQKSHAAGVSFDTAPHLNSPIVHICGFLKTKKP